DLHCGHVAGALSTLLVTALLQNWVLWPCREGRGSACDWSRIPGPSPAVCPRKGLSEKGDVRVATRGPSRSVRPPNSDSALSACLSVQHCPDLHNDSPCLRWSRTLAPCHNSSSTRRPLFRHSTGSHHDCRRRTNRSRHSQAAARVPLDAGPDADG